MTSPAPFLRLLLPAASLALAASCAVAPAFLPAAPPPALAGANQLVVVTTPGWDATAGELQRFVRAGPNASWRSAGDAVPIVVGRTGLAWGVGFDHLAEAGTPTAGPRKREGDGRSPAGAFPLGRVFGFAPAAAAGRIAMPYLPLTPVTECVDDTASLHYNAVLERSAVPRVDWRSAEHMRQVPVYRLGVIVDYNAAPAIKARGSCIFLHIWAGPRSTTSGCTALDETELERLVAWLDPGAAPVLVQVPAGVYPRLRAAWALPPLQR